MFGLEYLGPADDDQENTTTSYSGFEDWDTSCYAIEVSEPEDED